MNKKTSGILAACAGLIIILAAGFYYNSHKQANLPTQQQYSSNLPLGSNQITNQSPNITGNQTASDQVLNGSAQAPQLVISGNKEGYNSGGMVALSSTEEPAVNLTSYNLSGEASVDLYEASETALLDFLTHDKDNNQLKKDPSASELHFVANFKKTIAQNQTSPTKLLLPLKGTGIYYLSIGLNGSKDRAFIIRSGTGALVKQGDNQFVFWAQDFKTKKSLSGGSVTLYNLKDSVQQLSSSTIQNDGSATAAFNENADMALVQNGSDIAIVPINLAYLNTNYNYKPFQLQSVNRKYFLFTDRPVYKPGDTVYFKTIFRDDNNGLYSLPKGQLEVTVFKDWNQKPPTFQKIYQISPTGSIAGQFTLPADASTGYYQLKVAPPGSTTTDWINISYANFQVEFYRKPDYSLEITTGKTELVAGDKNSVTIHGSYFFGQPMAGQRVKYSVYSSDFYEYEYSYDQSQYIDDTYRYGYWGGNKLLEDEVVLDGKGEAVVNVDTMLKQNGSKSQVLSVEATVDDGSQNPSFARKNLVVYPGEFGIYLKDFSYSYGSQIGDTLHLPLVLIGRRATQLGGVKLTAHISRENWNYIQHPDKSYEYNHEQENLPDITVTTDSQGHADLSLKAQKPGSYTFVVEGKDAKGNTITKQFYSWMSSQAYPYYYYNGFNNNGLTVKPDKQQYNPGQTAKLYISSTIPDRDVFLSLQRDHVMSYQVVHMQAKTANVDIPLGSGDMPNVIAAASSFSDYALDRGSESIKVSAAGKKLKVVITPERPTFGPGDTVKLNVETKDSAGNPISAEVAVWAVDKALFELVDERTPDIFNLFWSERYDGTQENNSLAGIVTEGGAEKGGCFAAGTKVTMVDGTSKNIEDVKPGDMVLSKDPKGGNLVAAKVTATEEAEDSGYLILNGSLKVTVNHILNINGKWQEAGMGQLGDELENLQGQKAKISSIEWQGGKTKVYNLSVEKYHTYFAQGYWVHNDKGGGSPRSVFKDTAYWNPNLKTNDQGRASVSFKLPDNLTTWVISGVGATADTTVGQVTSEITVTKDVIVRPILPNILRSGDDLVLSAIVQNFTEQDHNFSSDLQFDSGTVSAENTQPIQIKAHGLAQVYWHVQPKTLNPKSKLTFSAKATDDSKYSDTVIEQVPVRLFGFWDKDAQVGEGPKTFNLNLAPDSEKNQTSVNLTLSPTLLGQLPQAMQYLVEYPYGCVEQTTSRFVPAIIAKENSDFFQNALEGKNIDAIINTGIKNLRDLQQDQGGWQWWHDGQSDSFISAYVIEYLLKAQALGYKVDQSILSKAQSYFENSPYLNSPPVAPGSPPPPSVLPLPPPTTPDGMPVKQPREDLISRVYALSLLGSSKGKYEITDLEGLTPDIIAMATITNFKNGFNNSAQKGVAKLKSMAKSQGEAVYWDAGRGIYFGSKDASTAWVIRALLMSNSPDDLLVAEKAARYLISSRQSEYWSNTFATSQVIRAITDLARKDQQLNPSYTYTVKLDGNVFKTGQISNDKDSINLKIPASVVKAGGSRLEISKNGSGQIYSTLAVKQFRTDPKAAEASHGISISRKYVNKKGDGIPIGVGDTVVVQLTVNGFNNDWNYGVIQDELPSGLVPINKDFKNEQYTPGAFGYQNYPDNYYDGASREVTENGMILSIYYWSYYPGTGQRVYSYEARAVAQGNFAAPPAEVSQMYSPEIYGRSEIGKLTIVATSEGVGEKLNNLLLNKFGKDSGPLLLRTVFVGLILLVIIVAFSIWRRQAKKPIAPKAPAQGQDQPPAEPK